MRWLRNGPRPARRDRADVLWWLGGFVLLQLGLAVSLDRWRADLRDPEYGCKLALLRRRLAEEPGRPLLLVVGSSRTLNGLRPDLLDTACGPGEARPLTFNFGLTGCGPLHELLCVRRLLDEGIRPRWLLVEVTPSLLLWDPPEKQLLPADRLTWADLGQASGYSDSAARLYARWLQARLVPWFEYRFRVLHRHLPGWVPQEQQYAFGWEGVDHGGWMRLGPITNPADYARHMEQTHNLFAPLLQKSGVAPSADRALRELLGLCRDEGIPLALVLMPEGESFRRWYTPAAVSAVEEYLAGLRGEFAVPLIDARDWVRAEDRFRDSHHLLPEGAAVFTERLGREGLGLLLAGGRR